MSQYNNGATTRSERYAVKSHKQIIALTTATVVTATISSTTINVSADEIKDNQQPDVVTQTNSNVATPKSDFDNAKNSEAQKLADLQAQQKADEEVKAQANADAQAATEQANVKALADAQAAQVAKDQADAQAAAQKLADQQAADESAKAQQAQAAQVAHDAEVAKQQQAATDFANQQAQESGSAQAQRDAATNQYNSDTKATQNNAATTDKAIDSDAQKATDKATTEQTTANQTVDAIQAQNTTDAKNQQASASNNQTADNTKTESAQKQANASTEASAQKAVTTAQANVNKSTVKTATPTNPYADDATFDQINSVGNLPTKISDPKIPASHVNDATYYDYYKYSGTNDNTAQIKGAPTNAQQRELADYAVTLVNSYRISKGLAPVRWTEQNQKAIIASAKAREDAGAGFQHTVYIGGSATQQTNDAYTAENMFLGGENLGVANDSDLTMLSAKVTILNVITAMIYQDGAHFNGHLNNFIANDEILGFALQKNDNDGWPYILIFQTASLENDSDLTTDIATTSTQTIEAARGGNSQANKQALTDAQAKLSQVKSDNATQLSNLQAKNQKALDSIKQAFADAIAQIKTTHDKAISQNATVYANEIASIKADATAKHGANATKLAETLANLKDNYDAKISSIKDMSPEELANKKATEKAAFDKVQATELATFETQQAQDAKTFATNLDTALANLKAQLDADLATKTAQGAKNLNQLQIQNTDAYNQLVSANAKALANLKASNVKSYAKAQADSQAYLNAINPANAKPSTPDHSKPNSGNTDKPSAPSHQTGHNTPTGTDSSQTSTKNSQATDGKSSTEKTNVSAHNDNFIYDANTKSLNRVSLENQYMNVISHPKINTFGPVKQVNQFTTTQTSLLPQTARDQQHSNQALLISLFGLLGVSLYAPKHMRNKRFNA
ncbi:SEC10/PgrA surface exclusion domain-containing protein [Leuconostoc gelidum]|uniref:SEC10/PgrA surface exclusion domain-containing protein n=1 Tax=Leuconostoc gelidum TaxID=1244 RepID=UPI0002191D7D|nr:SEC10/PgrA surface exclusion domain-containing protein [Leuconostoc gelidum]AFS40948.1 putative cell surface protein [Leuconostoc gelidum JB7]MBZ5992998.1 SEC10/PgrA surface exclusion domain-containing protein [Leuconostoc gelidum subsp. gelidum]USP17656.1 SEC10/PgrA surface exclusion domain-containing protein [Leuconostoc gelidum subsp. aenigmaticum]GMA67653.1 hypothetical protein GCM10025884_12800 [Leuconostoc gelidum subsp. gelidum]